MLLCFFFLFLVISNSFFIIPVVTENTKVKLALAIPAGTPITLAKEIIDTPHLLQIKKLKSCQNNQKEQCIRQVFDSLFFFFNF